MIKAVLFDYGGVLSPGGKNFKGSLARMLGVSPDNLGIEDLREGLWSGELSTDEFFAELSRRQGRTILSTDFLKASGILEAHPEVYSLADKIRKAGLKTAILSNMYKTSADLLRAGGHYDNFDPVILSFEEGLSKPDDAIYELALKRLGCQADEVVFIDDQERFLKPARRRGIHVIQAVSPEQVISDVKKILKQQNGLEL